MNHVELQQVCKAFHPASGRLEVIAGLDLSVGRGEFLCIVGPSGCGKSTLLALIAGLEFPDGGRVKLDGELVHGPSNACGMIFQEAPLFPWLHVEDNVAFSLKMAGQPAELCATRSRQLLDLVGLARFSKAWPHELSGGMRQRATLAAALAKDPEVLLMDEPFGALDAQTRDELHEELERLWLATGKTVVFVTHNVREAVRLGSRVLLMSARGGRIRKEYDVDLPRGRHLEDVELVRIASVIRDDLRAEVLAQSGRGGANGTS